MTSSEIRGGVCTIFIEAYIFEPQLTLTDEDISHLSSDLTFKFLSKLSIYYYLISIVVTKTTIHLHLCLGFFIRLFPYPISKSCNELVITENRTFLTKVLKCLLTVSRAQISTGVMAICPHFWIFYSFIHTVVSHHFSITCVLKGHLKSVLPDDLTLFARNTKPGGQS